MLLDSEVLKIKIGTNEVPRHIPKAVNVRQSDARHEISNLPSEVRDYVLVSSILDPHVREERHFQEAGNYLLVMACYSYRCRPGTD